MTYRMPDGRPAPSLMTPEQAIEFLQLEAEDGHQALRRLREVRELPAVRYSKSLRYRPEKLMEWLETQEV